MNCPVTVDDIETAQNMHGKDTLCVKGRTMRCNPPKTLTPTTATPKELEAKNAKITTCMDVMCIDKIGFMATMSHPMCHCGVLDKMLQVHNEGGFKIQRNECDQAFKSVVNEVSNELNINMDCVSTQDHVGAAERDIGTLKETICTKFHQCGCNTPPKQMIVAMAEQSADQLNMFPAKHGTSQCCSPNSIATGQTIDHERHCEFKFGECVQAHHKPRRKVV